MMMNIVTVAVAVAEVKPKRRVKKKKEKPEETEEAEEAVPEATVLPVHEVTVKIVKGKTREGRKIGREAEVIVREEEVTEEERERVETEEEVQVIDREDIAPGPAPVPVPVPESESTFTSLTIAEATKPKVWPPWRKPRGLVGEQPAPVPQSPISETPVALDTMVMTTTIIRDERVEERPELLRTTFEEAGGAEIVDIQQDERVREEMLMPHQTTAAMTAPVSEIERSSAEIEAHKPKVWPPWRKPRTGVERAEMSPLEETQISEGAGVRIESSTRIVQPFTRTEASYSLIEDGRLVEKIEICENEEWREEITIHGRVSVPVRPDEIDEAPKPQVWPPWRKPRPTPTTTQVPEEERPLHEMESLIQPVQQQFVHMRPSESPREEQLAPGEIAPIVSEPLARGGVAPTSAPIYTATAVSQPQVIERRPEKEKEKEKDEKTLQERVEQERLEKRLESLEEEKVEEKVPVAFKKPGKEAPKPKEKPKEKPETAQLPEKLEKPSVSEAFPVEESVRPKGRFSL